LAVGGCTFVFISGQHAIARDHSRASGLRGASGNKRQIGGLPVQLTEQALDRLHGGLVEVGFAALTAHPGGNRFQGQMVALAVDMKGRLGLPHFPLAGNPFSGPVAKLVTIWPPSTARALRQVQ
jgi:hypothetical protein